MKYSAIAALFATFAFSTSIADAATLNQARQLYLKGKYAEALPTFMENIRKNPRNANLNQWVGACLYETGKKEESVKYLEFAYSKNIADASRYLAQISLDNLDYQQAKEYITEYNEQIEDNDISEIALKEKERVERATAMLDNVEKIQIIDSLIVDKQDFFKHYRLSSESGSINTIDVLPYEKPKNSTAVFIPESRSRMIWAMPDSTGTVSLAETYRLNNGKWEKYSYLPQDLNMGGDANYPFMMADGMTLYYASNGENSIGGYDIFMTRKDLDNGEYLQPQNIGMPYNSPYDDYLLAIDEMTGAGWWATDRNRIPDKVTIYIFIPNEVRQNYDPNDDNISSLASVRSIKDTWEDNADYTQLKDDIATIDNAPRKENPDFIFHVKNGLVYTSIEDFNSSEAKSLMQKHLEIEKFLMKIRSQLIGMRAEYKKSNKAQRAKLANEIQTLERSILKNTEELQKLDNNIRAAEIPTLKK